MTRTIAEITEEMTRLKEEMKVSAQAAFKEGAIAVFDQFPKLDSFAWLQYTPFFNDGDECVFCHNAYEGAMFINGYSPEYEFSSTYYQSGGEDEEHETEPWEDDAAKAAAKFVSAFPDDILKDIFGDHAEVTVNRTGAVIVEEYADHN